MKNLLTRKYNELNMKNILRDSRGRVCNLIIGWALTKNEKNPHL